MVEIEVGTACRDVTRSPDRFPKILRTLNIVEQNEQLRNAQKPAMEERLTQFDFPLMQQLYLLAHFGQQAVEFIERLLQNRIVRGEPGDESRFEHLLQQHAVLAAAQLQQ